MQKQKQAVVSLVGQALGTSFVAKKTVVKELLTEGQKETIRTQVFEGIINGTIEYNGVKEDEKAVKKYVSSMVDNHIRKAIELNGGTPYKPTKSGSKRDSQLRELGKLLRNFQEESDEYKQIQEHIERRSKELDDNKAKKNSNKSISAIDTSILPAHLKDLVNSFRNGESLSAE